MGFIPRARQVPNKDARVDGVHTAGAPGTEQGRQGHLAVAAPLRPGAAADLTADDQVAQTPFGGVVVRRHVRFGHQDEEFLDMALDASAQSGGWGRRVVEERLTDGEQSSFQSQLGGAPSLGLGIESVEGVRTARRLFIMRIVHHEGRGCAGRGCRAAGEPSSAAGGCRSGGRRHRNR